MVRRVSDSACLVIEVVVVVVVVRLVQHVCVHVDCNRSQTLASQHINSACAIKFVEEFISAVIVIMIIVCGFAGRAIFRTIVGRLGRRNMSMRKWGGKNYCAFCFGRDIRRE